MRWPRSSHCSSCFCCTCFVCHCDAHLPSCPSPAAPFLPVQGVPLHKALLHHPPPALSSETQGSYIELHKNTTLWLMHSANRFLPLSSRDPPGEVGWEDKLRTANLLAGSLSFVLVYSSISVFLRMSCSGSRGIGGGGEAEGVEGLGVWGQDSICTGSWLGSGTCTCRHRTAGVAPDPGCF